MEEPTGEELYTMEEPQSGGACIQAGVWDTSVQEGATIINVAS